MNSNCVNEILLKLAVCTVVADDSFSGTYY